MLNSFKHYKMCIFIILSILLLFHGFNNYLILKKSRYFLSPDEIWYLQYSNDIFKSICNIKLNLESFYRAYINIFSRDRDYRPPLYPMTASPLLLFGMDKDIVIMSNLVYFAVLLFATYGIGKRLYNPNVGLLASFLVSMFPSVFALSRVLMVDFALAAIVALTFYLFCLNKFNSLKFSLLTGIVIILGMLIKQIYFIFLFPILLYFFFQRENFKSKKKFGNFLISILIGLTISISWYGHLRRLSFGNFYQYIFHDSGNGYLFYLESLLNRQLFPVFFLLFLLSLWFCYRNKQYFLPTMTIGLILLFSIPPNRIDRFILPIFPYIAVMISGFIWSITKLRKTFVTILILFSFLQFFIICFGNTLPLSKYDLIRKLLSDREGQRRNDYGLFSIIDQGDWQSQVEEIVKIINAHSEKNIDEMVNVLVISDKFQMWTELEYRCLVENLPFRLSFPDADSHFLIYSKSIPGNNNFNKKILYQNFVILEKSLYDKEFNRIHARKLLNSFKQNIDEFNFINAVLFPDNILCYLYKKNES